MTEVARYALIEVEEAQARVLAAVRPLLAESVPILESLGRVLAQSVTADMDVPLRTNAAMDGYAIRGEDLAAPQGDSVLRLRVVGEVAAGHLSLRLVGPGQAVRIMTGAVVPEGADTVVRFEDTRQEGYQVIILKAPIVGGNVRRAGEDVRRGETVLHVGTLVRPQEIGMMASVGRMEVMVHGRPRVAILATGDEVVEAGRVPGPGQIRDINSYSNAAQVLSLGGMPLRLGVARDRRADIESGIEEGISAGTDLFLTSGGVSVGDFDVVKEVIADRGTMGFWAVNMKPGKPLAFGSVGGVPFLGLPGNPVAAMISFALFARPAILKMLGHSDLSHPSVRARLGSSIERKDGRRHYLRVRLTLDGDGWRADLTGDQGSGILSSMVAADGLAVIPETCSHLEAGSEVEVLTLRG